MATARTYREYERRSARHPGPISKIRSDGKGLIRWGKVGLLWVAGGAVAVGFDHLLDRAGLSSPLARFLIEVAAGVAFIFFGGPSLGSFGSGMILGAGGALLRAELSDGSGG